MCVLTHSLPLPSPDKLKLAACYSQNNRLLHMSFKFIKTSACQNLKESKHTKNILCFSLVPVCPFQRQCKAGKVPTWRYATTYNGLLTTMLRHNELVSFIILEDTLTDFRTLFTVLFLITAK